VEAVSVITSDVIQEVTIKPYKKSRSHEQNALLHALMRQLSEKYSESYGETVAPEVWKEFFKQRFLGQESVEVGGEHFVYTRHTSKLSTAPMAKFIDQCVMWSAEDLGIVLTIEGEYDG